ncbi:MAG TPA: hypothetical protein DF774_17305 [Rheinheimera sp.]|uniref:hypothetical protein n=1 Tax=Rheinheimera sp. TaxID=1869214 RepID=UPI000EDE1A3A|nr:hypothetical protein [Rheinheimera sp.]HCU67509.1 hypothetical protein [Rheinheimera sp.]
MHANKAAAASRVTTAAYLFIRTANLSAALDFLGFCAFSFKTFKFYSVIIIVNLNKKTAADAAFAVTVPGLAGPVNLIPGEDDV